MKLARYWTRGEAEASDSNGEKIRVLARGWSDKSVEEARARALEVARRVAQRLSSFEGGAKERYPYGDRPLPEPILREFRDARGELSAIVTRNIYGALVLNASRLMFVDVDRKEAGSSAGNALGKMFSSLFGKKAADAPANDPALDAMNRVVERHGLSARVYETAGGHRIAITSSPFEPGSPAAQALLEEFDADPMFTRLCRLQESFRARLTPKPWRCNLPCPPVAFPFETTGDQERQRHWEAQYDSKTASYATCRFLNTLGSGTVLEGFNELLQYHDHETKSAHAVRLA